MNNLPYILAIDFDGTLCENKFPEIGAANHRLISELIRYKHNNPDTKYILWTCRDNNTPERNLDKAVEFCREYGLEFDAVNENLPEVKALFGNNDTRKVYAILYLDDKSMLISQFFGSVRRVDGGVVLA